MGSTFSEREREIMAYAWECFEEEPKIDYAKLAAKVGMTNERSASNAWRAIRKKLTTFTAGEGEGGDAVATPKTTPKRGRKKASADDGEETPAKKAKATPKSKKKKDAAAAEEAAPEAADADDEEKPKIKDEEEKDELA